MRHDYRAAASNKAIPEGECRARMGRGWQHGLRFNKACGKVSAALPNVIAIYVFGFQAAGVVGPEGDSILPC